MSKSNTFNQVIAEQAAYWVVLMDEQTLSTSQATQFTHWLQNSPQHIEEFLNACVLFDAVEHIDQYKPLLTELPEVRVAELHPVEPFDIPKNNLQQKRIVSNWRAISAAAAVLILSFIFYMQYQVKEAQNIEAVQFATKLGEQRSIVLSDGSIVFLNTNTEISLDFSDQYRNVRLHNGEAVFQVEHNPQRPFRVWIGDTMVQAIGTEFNIKESPEQTVVTVINGEIALVENAKNVANLTLPINANRGKLSASSPSWLDDAVILKKGQGAAVNRKMNVAESFTANLEKAISWKDRKLIFSGELLKDVVQEFNRYNKLQIEVLDETVSQLPISGIFTANDPQSLLDFLRLSGKVNVTQVQQFKITIEVNKV